MKVEPPEFVGTGGSKIEIEEQAERPSGASGSGLKRDLQGNEVKTEGEGEGRKKLGRRDWRGEPLNEDDHQDKRQRPGEVEVPAQVGVPAVVEVRVQFL